VSDPKARDLHFLFDLDDTLYPSSLGFFRLVSARIRAYVMRTLEVDERAASILQRRYWRQYGTSLAGLMARHGIDPVPFLEDVHQVPVEDVLKPDPALAEVLASLPGTRHVFTNGPEPYARRVLAALGIEPLFERTFDIVCFGYEPKPRPAPYETVTRALGPGARIVLIDDAPRNLPPARARGWRTVWLRAQEPSFGSVPVGAPEADVTLDSLIDLPARVPELLEGF
jgi:putative hydrolase of the HAD superfamily